MGVSARIPRSLTQMQPKNSRWGLLASQPLLKMGAWTVRGELLMWQEEQDIKHMESLLPTEHLFKCRELSNCIKT